MKNKTVIFNIILLFIFMSIGCIISLILGFDNDFDTLNYHYYNAYAFLNNRIGHDIMPASIQTYLNPLMDCFFYYIVKYFNHLPHIAGLIFGLSYGLLCFMTFQIAQIIFKTHTNRIILSLFSTITGCSATYTIFTIGRQSHDIFTSFLILCGVYFILKSLEKDQNIKFTILAGFIFGCTCGLKYMCVPFALGMLLSVLINKKLFVKPYKTAGIFLLTGILGFLIINGFWIYKLYISFGNPFMPYFSEIFCNQWINSSITIQSADANTFHYVKPSDVLLLPFLIHSDYRPMTIFIIFIANLYLYKRINSKIMKDEWGINIKYLNLLLIFSIFSILFLRKFFIELRYSCSVLALSGIFVIGYVCGFVQILKQHINDIKISFIKNFFNMISNKDKYKSLAIIIYTAICILLITTVDLNCEKIVRRKIQDKIIFVKATYIKPNSIVITYPGTAFVIPFLTPKAKYIFFPDARFIENNIKILSANGTAKLKDEINNNKSDIYILTPVPLNKKTYKNKNNLNFNKLILKKLYDDYEIYPYNIGKCTEIINNIGNIGICDIKIKSHF